jgi:hypothetical protein
MFSVIWGGVGLIAAAKGISSHRTDLLYGAAICGCCWAAYIAWFRSFALETDGDSLFYSAPLVRRITISLSEIRSVSFRKIDLGSKWRSAGYQKIIVERKADSASPIVLNTRVFPQEGLKLFFGNLGSRGIPVSE